MKKKKRIKIIIIAALVVAVAAGSITGVVYYRNSKGLASVMSVSMISTTNDYTSMTSGGMVCDDACQTINLKDGQKVTEVYVTKDQQVKAGDKLLAYDVTSLSLSVEMKQLEIQSLENQLASEKQKLDKLKNTKPVEKQPETPVTPEPQPDTQPSAPDEQHDVISDLSEVKGSGTEDDPYVFTCTEASYVSGKLLNTLSEKSAVARFVIGDADAPDMELIVRGDRLGGYDESDEIKLFLAGTTTAGDASDDTEGSEPSDTKTDSATEQTAQTEADTAAEEKTYTADELNDAVQSSKITNEFAKRLGMSEEQLFKYAAENTRRLFPPVVRSMNDIMREMFARDGMPQEIADMMIAEIPPEQTMWVISNEKGINGAASMLYENELHELAESLESDLYILPSSVHEVIAVSSDMGSPEMLAQMVVEVNMQEVSLDERLSNQVYHYDKDLRKLTLATDTPNKRLDGIVAESPLVYDAKEKSR